MDKKLTIDLFGERLTVTDYSSEEDIRQAVELVKEKLQTVSQISRVPVNKRLGIAVALQIADDYVQLKKDYEDLKAILIEQRTQE